MTPKEFQKYLTRDGHCLHCGGDGDDLIPQHRLNRGAGGKNAKAARPSNIITFCSFANQLAESDSEFARRCRDYGWKLHSWQDPSESPVYDLAAGVWYQLDDKFRRSIHPGS
jgi:hypothetical protein